MYINLEELERAKETFEKALAALNYFEIAGTAEMLTAIDCINEAIKREKDTDRPH